MKRIALIAISAALSACGTARIDIQYHPTAELEKPRLTKIPKIYVADVEDQMQSGFRYNGVGGTLSGSLVRPITETLKDAVEHDLKRLGVHVTATRGAADAVLKAAVTTCEITMHGGISAPADSVVAAAVQLRALTGDILWREEFTGKGSLPATAPGIPGRVPSDSMNIAFSNLMRKFLQALDEDGALAKVFGAKAAYALARAELPPEPVVRVAKTAPSDVDDVPPARAGRPHRHAVVIGVERYREKLPAAEFAAGDARLAAEYYKRALGVPEQNVAVLTDERATKSDFEKYFERWLPNRVQPGDEVFVYYSGHGAPNPKNGDSYLVPYDADPTYIDETGYPVKRLYESLARLPAKKVYVAMDSCFSGAGGRSVIARGARPLVNVHEQDVPDNITVLAASGADQISNGFQEKGHGLFTYFYLKGIKTHGDDLRAVFEYLQPEVSKVARREYNADQEPQWRGAK